MATITIEPEFGYVALVVGTTYFLNIWQMLNIKALRKKYNIQFPAMTSDKHPKFNCAQRVHQNTLENMSFFLTNLIVAGLRMPVWAGALGAFWIVGRVIYSIGYYSGEPSKRTPGAIINFISMFLLIFLSIYSGLGMLGVV
jgi:glutathione S-transferase